LELARGPYSRRKPRKCLCARPPFSALCVAALSPSSATDELQTLRNRLDGIDGVETKRPRPGDATEAQFQGYVTMRTVDRTAVRRLLTHLGDPFWAVFHVGDQKCELGFRIEVKISNGTLQHELRFWRCPEWGLHRIRRFLARRVASDAARDELPSLQPPAQVNTA